MRTRTGTPKRGNSKLATTTIVYAGGVILQRAFSILLLPVLTRVLSVDEFGLAGTGVTLGSLFAVVFGFGLAFTIIRLYYDEPDAPATVWASLVRLQIAASAIMALVALATGPLWAGLLSHVEWGAALRLAVLTGWVMGIQQTVLGLLRAAQRPFAFASLTTIQVVVGGGAGLFFATRWGAAGYVAGTGLGTAVSAVPGLWMTYRRPRWDVGEIVAGIRVSLPAMSHQISSWGLELVDRLLVVGILGLAAAGRYQIAYTVGSALTLLLTGAQMAWSPSYMSRSERARRELPAKLALPTGAAAFSGTLMLVLASPLLVAAFAPPEYRSSQALLALVAAAAVPRAVYFALVVTLVDRKKTGRMALATGVGVILNISLNLVLLRQVGLIGAGIANLVSTTAMALLVTFAASRILNRMLPIRALLIGWIVGSGALLLVAQIPTTTPGVAARALLLIPAAGAGVYFANRLRGAIQTTG